MATTKTKAGKRLKVSPGTKGAISEHIATAWLLSQGLDVFRNVSPNGRADLLAVDWDKDETFRVDVKSQGFMRSDDARGAHDGNVIALNQGFNIRYVVVGDDGRCDWYSEEVKAVADNDNKPQIQWWLDRKTMQRFLTPGNYLKNKEWTYFCHWLVRAYPDYIVPFKESFVRDISARGIGRDNPSISSKEVTVLEKLHLHVYGKLVETDAVDHMEYVPDTTKYKVAA